MFKINQPFYQANADAGADGAGGEGGTETTLTFEAWQESLPQEHKTLIESHTRALKNALDSERETRKELDKQLRNLAKKAEAGSDAQTQLNKLADDLQGADRKAEFYESAHAAGVKNLKLAYTVAVSDEMFDKHGRVNFDEMKKTYPELFAGTSPTRGNAGNGTDKHQGAGANMNDFIRAAAGKQ